jgi:hypothetical protein
VRRDDPLALVKQLGGVPCGGGHYGYPDFGTAMQVKVTRLGDRDTGIAAAQLGDQRPHDAPLLLEGVDIAKQHVERKRSYIHRRWGVVHRGGAPVPPPAGPIRLSGLRVAGY